MHSATNLASLAWLPTTSPISFLRPCGVLTEGYGLEQSSFQLRVLACLTFVCLVYAQTLSSPLFRLLCAQPQIPSWQSSALPDAAVRLCGPLVEAVVCAQLLGAPCLAALDQSVAAAVLAIPAAQWLYGLLTGARVCAAAGSNLAAAPNLSERGRRGSGAPGGGCGGGPRGDPSLPKVLWKRTLRQLSSLPLAIGELAVIAVLSSLGTIIEQNKPLEFYQQVLPAVTTLIAAAVLGLGHRSTCGLSIVH